MKSNIKTIQKLLNEEAKKTVFSEQPEPLTTEEKLAFREALKTFSQMGESVYGTGKLQEVVDNLSKVVETANRLVTEESDDLVDSVSASRQFKNINGALNEFKKSANEIIIHERRMSAAFEDIAQGIQKYYDVH
tara:strand:- start:331 stop:732 length:402 start_codon:yes stop_codon:yes gene_type:complete